MKQILLSLAVVFATAQDALAQHSSLQAFIDKYRQDQAFSYAFLSKDLFEVTVQSEMKDVAWKKLHNVVRNIGSLRVLAADSLTAGLLVYKEAMEAIPFNEFDELLTVQDGKDRVRIWAKDDDKVVTDLLLLVGTPEEFVLVCFAGNLELDNISALASLFDAETVEGLAKTSQLVAVEFSISPNPSNGVITLQYASADDQAIQLTVLDQGGRQLTTLNLEGASNVPLNLPHLPAGTYWIQLKTQKGKVGVKPLQIVH